MTIAKGLSPMGNKLPADLEERSDRARARSVAQLQDHVQLQSELAAIQQELERRVSLARQRKGTPPWTKRSS